MRVAILLASAALVVAPGFAPAWAQTSSQLQLRGAYSGVSVNVGQANDVGATSIAGGNAVTRNGDGARADLVGVQRMEGDAEAHADARINGADNVSLMSAAVANGATVTATNGDVDADITQFGHGDATAATHINAGNVDSSAASSSASANTTALSAENGDIRGNVTQESTGAIAASSDAAHRSVYGQAVGDAVASANNVSAAGSTTTLLMNVNQHASGPSVDARVALSAARTQDAVGNATANANAASVDNAWGYVNATVRQQGAANVSAASTVTVGGLDGFASAGAYGVGNSMTASNVASDTVLDVVQGNTGSTDANATLDSGAGGDQALASSAAYGNVVTGSLCGYCNDGTPGLNANSTQVNQGPVRSTASVTADRARQVLATSSAIGNAATYQVTGH